MLEVNNRENTIPEPMTNLLKRPPAREDVRITTYLEAELYDELMSLKNAGISIKKLVNVAIGDLLKKHDII